MLLVWNYTESFDKPLEVDTASTPSGVYLRKDITEVETESAPKWTYQEAFLGAEYKFDATTLDEYLAKLLEALKMQAVMQNDKLYHAGLNKPLPYDDCFLLADWITTYNNALATAKSKEERGLEGSTNIIVLSITGQLKNILVYSVENFQPMFDIVADEWARLTDKRNQYLVEIQNTKTIDELDAIEIDYSLKVKK